MGPFKCILSSLSHTRLHNTQLLKYLLSVPEKALTAAKSKATDLRVNPFAGTAVPPGFTSGLMLKFLSLHPVWASWRDLANLQPGTEPDRTTTV